MTVEIKKSQKRNYQIFQVIGNLTTNSSIELRADLEYCIKNYHQHVCINLSELMDIDAAGISLLENTSKLLEKGNRKFVLMGCSDLIMEKIKEKIGRELKNYSSDYEFEKTFFEDLEETKQKYFNMANGKNVFKSLSLVCPLCNTSGFRGYLCDESKHEMAWKDSDITPQWCALDTSSSELDFELYEVSVCPKCFFASARIEHFGVESNENTIPSILKSEQKERILRASGQRNKILNEEQKNEAFTFFNGSHEAEVGYASWQLYDKTLRGLPKDRTNIDSLEVARANILTAKFSHSEEDRDKALSTALVWLNEMVTQPELFVAHELSEGYVYLISVQLAMEKESEAGKSFKDLLAKYGKNEELEFYIKRAEDLMLDD